MSSTSINVVWAGANTTAQSTDSEVTVRGRCFPRGGWSFDTNLSDNTVQMQNAPEATIDISDTEQTDYTLPPPLPTLTVFTKA